ncbi:hypothetical protein DRN62_00635 [Nanoarchaeota archaeon]|nr:MAG: hypothetical protein DRN62_00635 [Nanoarchaeota archaeon]
MVVVKFYNDKVALVKGKGKVLGAAFAIATSNRWDPNPLNWVAVFEGERVDVPSLIPEEQGKLNKMRERYRGRPEKFLESLRRQGHYIPFEFTDAIVYFPNASRWETFFLWTHVNAHQKVMLGGLEQSLRRTMPGGFVDVGVGGLKRLYERASEFYGRAISQGVPYQEARRGLPMNAKVYMALEYNPRYINKLKNALEHHQEEGEQGFRRNPEFNEVISGLEALLEEEWGAPLTDELPARPLSLFKEPFEGGDGVYYNHFLETLKGYGSASILTLHQLIRNRQARWGFNFPKALREPSFVEAPEFPPDILEEYEELGNSAAMLQWELYEKDRLLAPYAMLLGQRVPFEIYIAGEDALKDFAKARRCKGAVQPETFTIVDDIFRRVGLSYGPSCWTGKCRERRSVRERCEKITQEDIERWKEVYLRRKPL